MTIDYRVQTESPLIFYKNGRYSFCWWKDKYKGVVEYELGNGFRNGGGNKCGGGNGFKNGKGNGNRNKNGYGNGIGNGYGNGIGSGYG